MQIVAAHKRSLVECLAEFMRDAGTNDPESVAVSLGVLVDGAIAQAAVFGPLDPIHTAREVARRIVESQQSLTRERLGGCPHLIDAVGEPPVREAIVEGLAPYRTPSGGCRLTNEWHALVASAS